MGTATLVTMRIKDEDTIEATNLGDSGYSLFHVLPDDSLEMYYRSESQQWAFNAPNQCGTEGNDASMSDVQLHNF